MMKRYYEIRENNDQDVRQHEIIGARDSRHALQIADSIPAGAKSWSCESASGQAEDDFCLIDPTDEYHSWSAELAEAVPAE
jgi:hypothetical protein